MTPFLAGDLRLVVAEWFSANEFALAIGVPARTARRWLQTWERCHVSGIRTVLCRGRYGKRFEASRSLVGRWKRGELPSPFNASQRRAA